MNHKQCNYRQVFDTIAVKIKATKRETELTRCGNNNLNKRKKKPGTIRTPVVT